MNSWIISGIILLIGFFICLILIFRHKWKASRKNIDSYQGGRDKLTERKKEKEPEEDFYKDVSIFTILSRLIHVFIVMFVGFTLLPLITEQMEIALASNEVSSMALSFIAYIPAIFTLGVVMTAITIVVNTLKESELI
jgi:uncharacterized membrane protein